jgi:hypothetical protein
MAYEPLATVVGQLVGMGAEQRCNLGLDGPRYRRGEIEALAAKDEKGRRLMTIPGPLGAPSSQLLATVNSSRRPVIWQRGLALFRSNIPQVANPRCSVLASAETATFVGF